MMKRTKIVATVGPASGSHERLRALVEAGADVFRINFSHGDEEQRGEFLKNIRAVEQEVGRPVAVCGDLCGPKIRVGMIQGREVRLEADRQIVVQRTPVEGMADRISTTLAELVDVVRPGERILLADVEQLRKQAVAAAKDLGLAAPGDRIILLVGHPLGTPGSTKGLIVEDVE